MKDALLKIAKENPQVTANLLVIIAESAKSDPAIMSGLLALAAGEMKISDFAKTDKGLVSQLLGALILHPEILAALLSAIGT